MPFTCVCLPRAQIVFSPLQDFCPSYLIFLTRQYGLVNRALSLETWVQVQLVSQLTCMTLGKFQNLSLASQLSSRDGSLCLILPDRCHGSELWFYTGVTWEVKTEAEQQNEPTLQSYPLLLNQIPWGRCPAWGRIKFSPGDCNEQPGSRATGFNYLNNILNKKALFKRALSMCCTIIFVVTSI